jgi:hypothetical protein
MSKCYVCVKGDDNGKNPVSEGTNGVFGGTRMANEGFALPGSLETICARRGVVEINKGSMAENAEIQLSDGVATDFDLEYQLFECWCRQGQ